MQLNNNLSAQGLNINIGATATSVNGILATHNSGSLSTTLYTVGGVLNNTNIVSVF
jgi:CHASE2 domain-containing sensor protein